MKDLPEAWALVAGGRRAAGARARPARPRPRAGSPPRRAARRRHPPFDRSAMDGYAVRSADTGAGALRAGRRGRGGRGADADARAGHRGRHLHRRADPAGRRRRAPGGRRARRRQRARRPSASRPRHARPLPRRGRPRRRPDRRRRRAVDAARAISALAAAGRRRGRRVHRRARVHLLVTGSELLPLGAPPGPGKIHETNGLMVRLLAERAGAAGDRPRRDRRRLRRPPAPRSRPGLAGDVLVVSGGV